MGIEEISSNCAKAIIQPIQLETYEDWAYIYVATKKLLVEYKEKMNTFQLETISLKQATDVKADDVQI